MRTLLLTILTLTFLSCEEAGNNNPQNETAVVKSAPEKTAAAMELAKPFTTIDACVFSQISYCRNPQQQLDTYFPGWKIVWHPSAVSGNHAFVASNGQTYVVAIRGSLIEFSWDAFDNWIYQDLNVAVQKNWPYASVADAKISQGSYRGWDNLNKMSDTSSGKNLLDFLLEQTTDKTPIIFTGHSLGGNLATVYASYFSARLKEARKKTDHINVISFAAPAAGNEGFAKDFDQKFPKSVRVENNGDIVAKFPCAGKVTSLGELYSSIPASSIKVGYKNMTVSLSSVFQTISTAMTLLEFKNGLSHFEQTNGSGTMITVKPSGKNTAGDVQSWFAEAGYQHGVKQYAVGLAAPVVDCQ